MQTHSGLFDAMPDSATAEDMVREIYKKYNWHSYTDDRLAYREYVMPDNTDEDIDALIAWYTDKKSKRVQYSGKRLRRVFLELPPVEQRKVGLALLTGSKTDVEWVCKNLDSYKASWDAEWVVRWHPDYAESVEKAWKKHKGKFCGRLLVQFLDTATVRKHLDELLEEDQWYYALCRRFVNEDWFSLDRDRLARCTSINAYLSIMSQTAEGIADDEARRLLYQWIATIVAKCKDKHSAFRREEIFWRDFYMPSVLNAWGIDTAMYYLLKMNKRSIVEEFVAWNKKVVTSCKPLDEMAEYSLENHDRFVNAILDNFPPEYKYLTYLNGEYYNYAFSIAQPFTTPRILPWLKDEEDRHPPYLSEPVKDCDNSGNDDHVDTQFRVEDMIEEFPAMQTLVDKLGLSPLIQEEEADEMDHDLPY